jgi:prevent-host-death family protein
MDKPLPENAARRAALKSHVVLKGGSLADAGPPICATIATGREVRVRTISHRELRNNSAEVLRAVGAGETIEVTNHGEVAAVLVPPSLTPYERLAAAGKIREPRKDRPVDLRSIRRVSAPLSSAEIIADVRGDR